MTESGFDLSVSSNDKSEGCNSGFALRFFGDPFCFDDPHASSFYRLLCFLETFSTLCINNSCQCLN